MSLRETLCNRKFQSINKVINVANNNFVIIFDSVYLLMIGTAHLLKRL